jgi:hypothetical protein
MHMLMSAIPIAVGIWILMLAALAYALSGDGTRR